MSDVGINVIFAKKLNYYLSLNEKNQLDLAKYLDVSGAAVSNWCKGIKMPRIDKIDRICQFLNITPSDLMEEANVSEGLSTLNPDIRMIAMAGKKMTESQAETLRKYAVFMFPEAFDD